MHAGGVRWRGMLVPLLDLGCAFGTADQPRSGGFVVMMEISYMTPPFGFNLFYLRSVAPPDVTMKDIYWSVGPYTVVELTGLFIIVLFPAIALWLPNYLFQVN